MGAGSLAHAAHTRDLERMGGLLRRLPATGGAFLVGALALAALPPLNGFISEWLLYLGFLEALRSQVGTALAATLGVAALATIGAVAAVAFTRLAGVALLGSPRSPGAAGAGEPEGASWAPLALLAAGCLALGLFPAEALRLAAPAVAEVARLPAGRLAALLAGPSRSLALPMRAAALALGAASAVLWLWRARLLPGRGAPRAETWGCGFARPSPRMQYTGSSYAQFLSALAPRLLSGQGRAVPPRGLFPGRASLSFRRVDPARSRLFDPLFAAAGERFLALRRFQTGKLYLQLLYTVLTLVALVLFLVLRRG
jgi:NADH:ubiquinone oxidoreductase subunit 5 (subunit L)/multisubunit Na+/H+ antiporter MnhA subunit